MKVTYLDHMGSDLTVVNAARVSFGKRSEWEGWVAGKDKRLSDRDTKLIQFLARGMTTADFEDFVETVRYYGWEALEHGHGTADELIDLIWQWRRTPTHFAPFAHPQASFHIKAPIFVARQLAKHQVGMVWSEVSRRYVDDEPEFYTPEVWRKRAENVKQGSADKAVFVEGSLDKTANLLDEWAEGWKDASLSYYKDLLKNGVCPEQARMVLPQSTMTEWIWTGSLYAWANVFNQRKPVGHAQRETQEVARQIGDIMHKYYPVSWEALTA